MKTHQIEIQRLKSLINDKGAMELRVDALVLPNKPRDEDGALPSTMIRFSEADARSLFMLLKGKLAELDGKKARSQR